MATITKRSGANKRKSGKNWIVRIRRANQPQISRSFQEYSEAKRWAQDKEADLNARPFSATPKTGYTADQTIRAALQLYTVNAPDRMSVRSWKAAERPIVEYWLAHPFAERAIPLLYRHQIKGWIGQNKKDGKPAATTRKRLDVLARAIDVGLEEWNLQSIANPARKHKIPKDERTRRRPRPAERADLYAAAKASKSQRLYWAMRWCEECGMRREEIARLEHAHIDWRGKAPILRIPKTKTVPREFYMWPALVELYHEISAVFNHPKYLFGAFWMGSITQAFGRIRDKLGINCAVVFHSFRYEANSRMADRGVEQKLRMAIMGHVDESTNDGYTQFSEDVVSRLQSASAQVSHAPPQSPIILLPR